MLIWQDDAYGLIRRKMDLELGHDMSTDFGNPDFADCVESSGARGYRIDSASDCCPPPPRPSPPTRLGFAMTAENSASTAMLKAAADGASAQSGTAGTECTPACPEMSSAVAWLSPRRPVPLSAWTPGWPGRAGSPGPRSLAGDADSAATVRRSGSNTGSAAEVAAHRKDQAGTPADSPTATRPNVACLPGRRRTKASAQSP